MKKIIAVLLILLSCNKPSYQCNIEEFGIVTAEYPIRCEALASNIKLAYKLFSDLGLEYEIFSTRVVIRGKSDLGSGVGPFGPGRVEGMTHLDDFPAWIELAREGKSLMHELLHIHSPELVAHAEWQARGYYRVCAEYRARAQGLE